ncbi:ubiquitin carboxyl-terminal hydrolase Usp2-like isoform X2 [Neocloeon triangulifer]|uniref:ubiquitin carboxyl-terminal hydrolase Usp2-like isoform X2 n=1 Tax=Neocloeon triangulifer TaxID=2078957 RepID=UPI00286F6292|nr:ubiquitin carboxyl-terminal hydrolase Usp2-like isoform X2 [Neocloeon triangulifer]
MMQFDFRGCEMPVSSSYSRGDVTVLPSSGTSRIMPVPSSSGSTRRSFSSTSGVSSTGSYSYRTIERPSYLNSVNATGSYLTNRPTRISTSLNDYKPSEYKSSIYNSSSTSSSSYSTPSSGYRSRLSGMSSTTSSASSANSYSSSSYSRTSSTTTDTDNRERENGTTSSWRSRVYNDPTLNSTLPSSKRLDGGQQTTTSSASTSSPSSNAGRLQRPTLQESIDAVTAKLSAVKDTSSGATSKYKSSYLNDVSVARPTTLRSRTTQDPDLEDKDEARRPSVLEMRRLFDPLLTSSDSNRGSKEAVTSSVTTSAAASSSSNNTDQQKPVPSKQDSDDESSESEESEESEESSTEEVATADTKNQSSRRSRANTSTGLPAGSEDGAAAEQNDEGSSSGLEGSPRLGRGKNERGGLVGLRNIGNTCFMNSVLQCLSNTRPLLEYILAEGYLSEINTTTSAMKGALIKAFGSLLQELWKGDSDERVVNTSAFKSQVQRFAPRFMGYAQQDAQEFLRYLLEGLHEDVNRVTTRPKPILTEIDDSLSDSQKAMEAWKRYLRRDDSKIVDIFVGQLKSTLRCTVCGHCSVTFDPFWDLSLPIPSSERHGQVRLSQCFDLFTKEEVLDGDEKPTCSRCQTRQKCTKSFSIHKFPRILVLHLKRFSPMERFRGKLSCTVDFPLQSLDLSAYASASKGNSLGQTTAYNLYGVANHSGTTYSGHYVAACKHPYSGAWHEYNDSRVSSTSARSVVSSEAYVLFYELASSNTNSTSSHL